MTVRFVSEPTALVSGSGAALLARLLTSPQVRAFRATAGWTHGGDIEEAISSIVAAGRAWETSLDLAQRDTATRRGLVYPTCEMLTVEESSERLNLSNRQIQHLARSGRITGRRVGRRWELDVRSVTKYQKRAQ
ncbi:MAG: hypothetical protein DLM60_19655 [Pseudonocardiales bacterium]|nr:MAG: hypothetical protein DLM60_19655 [Pseudonocardiales bacterium]